MDKKVEKWWENLDPKSEEFLQIQKMVYQMLAGIGGRELE